MPLLCRETPRTARLRGVPRSLGAWAVVVRRKTGEDQILVTLGGIRVAAGKGPGKRRQHGRTPPRKVFGQRLADNRGRGLLLDVGVKLELALQRFGHEDGRALHMLYDSI